MSDQPGRSGAVARRAALTAIAALSVGGVGASVGACGETDEPAVVEAVVDAAAISSVRAPAVLLPGSPIVMSVGFGALRRETAELEVSVNATVLARLTPTGPLEFAANATLVDALEGGLDVTLVLDDGRARTAPFRTRWDGARQLPLEVSGASNAPAYYGQELVLQGTGFVGPSEATVSARIVGTFTPVGGNAEPLDVTVPVVPAERLARDRGVLTLPVALGGLREGDVAATITVTADYAGGTSLRGTELPIAFTLLPPDVFRPVDDALWLGEALRLSGGGFVEEPGVTTIVNLRGTFSGPAGTTEVDGVEVVLDEASGSEGAFYMRAVPEADALVSDVFGQARGTFEGTAQLSVTDGNALLEGAAAPLSFRIQGVRQVVWVRTLPGFYESLDRFGLGAAAGAIETQVRDRMVSLYSDWAVDFRLEEPLDVEPNHVTRIDLGGPDPNGIGLFGFDNTPGKDVHNLRLFDVIGGANFDTQVDGYPGYGGVFIESMLWWSSAPPAADGGELTRPTGSPAGDPEFDALFDPIFARPATPAEISGEGDPVRVAQVAAAVSALANAIGETAAHELGHSFGLAQPTLENVFHNNGDTPGCLMDQGADRPFGERAALPGFTPTRWCGDAPAYLDSILPLN